MAQVDERIRQIGFVERALRRPELGSIFGLIIAVSYTHLRAHETKANLVCRRMLE